MTEPVPKRPAGAHPNADELYQARNEPGSPRATALLAHAAACATCSEELLRQEAFDHPEPVDPRRLDDAWARFQRGEDAVRSGGASARSGSVLRPALLLAATLTVAVLGLSLWKQQTATSGLAGPGSGSAGSPAVPPPAAPAPAEAPQAAPAPNEAVQEEDVHRGGAAGQPTGGWSPVGKVSAAPTILSFPDVRGETVRATLFNLDHSYSWTSPTTTEGRATLPEAERRKLTPRVDYYWTVIGEGPERATVRFRIDR